jgi:hypothetical protein
MKDEEYLAKKLSCDHPQVVKNDYHGAINKGANLYCSECDSHLKLVAGKLYTVYL